MYGGEFTKRNLDEVNEVNVGAVTSWQQGRVGLHVTSMIHGNRNKERVENGALGSYVDDIGYRPTTSSGTIKYRTIGSHRR